MSFKTFGYWSLPSDPDQQHEGELIVEGESVTLTLFGCTSVNDEQREVPIISGIGANGKEYTLYKCHLGSRTMSFPGIPTIEFSAEYLLQGDRLTEDELVFGAASVQFSSLNEWVDAVGFHDFRSDDESTEVHYRFPDPIHLFKDGGVDYTILFHRHHPLFAHTHKFYITQTTLLRIESQGPFTIDGLWKHLNLIRGFLTLAYFSEAKIVELKLKRGERWHLLTFSGQKQSSEKEKKSKRDFLFTYKVIKEDLQTVFAKWCSLRGRIEPVAAHLQECFGDRTILSEHKFLNVVQGLETFHRRLRRNEKVPASEHKSRVKEIVETSPEEYRKWLLERLSFSNEPTLQERLQELFGEVDEELKRHLFPNPDDLIKKAKNSRNYYTHYGVQLEKKALKGSELFMLTERLKILMLFLVLKEVGISPQALNKIIKEGSAYLFNHLILQR